MSAIYEQTGNECYYASYEGDVMTDEDVEYDEEASVWCECSCELSEFPDLTL